MSENRTRSAWAKQLPGLLGAAWVIGGFGYALWTRAATLNSLGKVLLSSVWMGIIAFAVSVMLPVSGQQQLRASDVGNFWSFVRAAEPSDPVLRAQWRAFRRSIAILATTALVWLAYLVASSFGVTRAA